MHTHTHTQGYAVSLDGIVDLKNLCVMLQDLMHDLIAQWVSVKHYFEKFTETALLPCPHINFTQTLANIRIKRFIPQLKHPYVKTLFSYNHVK